MSERYRTPFGHRLFEARRGAGLTQSEVCKHLQISQGTLSELEKSGLSSGLVPQLALLYDVDPHYLSTGTMGVVREGHAPGLAQTVSHPGQTVVPHKDWNALLNTALPPRFTVSMPDASMTPRIKQGDIVTFSTAESPRAGDGVLVRDADGTMYVRVYRERRAGAWEAHAVNDAYQPMESERDGLVILAVLVGLHQRWG